MVRQDDLASMVNHSDKAPGAAGGSSVPAAPAGSKEDGDRLPPHLEEHLAHLVNSAAAHSSRRGVDARDLLETFTSGSYTPRAFHVALDALRDSRSVPGPKSRFYAWLLGMGRLNDQDRGEAINGLRSILGLRPKSAFVSTRALAIRAAGWTAGILALFHILWFLGALFGRLPPQRSPMHLSPG